MPTMTQHYYIIHIFIEPPQKTKTETKTSKQKKQENNWQIDI